LRSRRYERYSEKHAKKLEDGDRNIAALYLEVDLDI
jgi:hypothetical protein